MPPRGPSFTDFDRSYRKGVVLGLSLAEIFIILTFLLLLTLIGYGAYLNEKVDNAKEKLDEVSTTKISTEKTLATTRDEKKTLRVNLTKSEKEIQRLQYALHETKSALTTVQQENTTLGDSLTKSEKQLQRLQNMIKDSDPQNLVVKNETLERKLNDQNIINSRLTEKLSKIERNNTERALAIKILKEENIKVKDLPEILKQSKKSEPMEVTGKGHDSSCWYKMVPDNDNPGKQREKPLYIFNIRIFDSHVFVKDIRAPDEHHALKKDKLKFNRDALNKDIKFKEFIKAFMPLKKSGIAHEVRDRRCTFYVRLWDATTTKSSYKQATQYTVQQIFNIEPYEKEPWRH